MEAHLVRYFTSREEDSISCILNIFCTSKYVGIVRLFMICVSLAVEQEWRPKSFLVLFNPFAGVGNGECNFNRTVLPMLDLAGLRYTVKVTGM